MEFEVKRAVGDLQGLVDQLVARPIVAANPAGDGRIRREGVRAATLTTSPTLIC